MPKGKSSASAGTRKKHAKKAAAKDGEEQPKQQHTKLQRGQKKLSKAQQRALPKVKQYIPPPKAPAPPIPDPLDGQGLARTLPAELVVVLRRLGKKDDVTRRKGLEELREGWIADLTRSFGEEEDEVERELKETALVSAIPVWMHNLASLLQSPFHRSFALQLHTELLSIPSSRAAISDTLSLSLLPGTQNRDVLGSWLVAALEEGRRAGGAGLRSWDESTTWLKEGSTSEGKIDLTPQTSTLVEYLSLSVLDPISLHDDIHPAPVQANPAPPAKGAKGAKAKQPFVPVVSAPPEQSEQDNEMADEKWARYRVGGLVGLGWLLQQLKGLNRPLPSDAVTLIHNPALWSSLSSLASEEGSPAFGHNHSPVRRAAFSVLASIVDLYPEEIGKEDVLQTLAREMLDVVWLEKEATVWETAGPTVVKVLSRHREIWGLSAPASGSQTESRGEGEAEDDDGDESDSSDEDEIDEEAPNNTAELDPPETTNSSAPIAFERFLEFISTICPSIPHRTYPLLLVIISTIPSNLLPLDGPSTQLKTLFAHLWSPVDARLLSTHALPGQPSAFQAFLRDAIDCTTFLLGKAHKSDENHVTAEWLVMEQLGERTWKEGVLELGGRSAGRRAVAGSAPEQEATLFGQGLTRVLTISPDLGDRLADLVVSSLLEAITDQTKSQALLPRILPIMKALKASIPAENAQKRLEKTTEDIVAICARQLNSADPDTSSAKRAHTEALIAIITSDSTLVPASTLDDIVTSVDASSSRLLADLSPALFAALLTSLGSVNEQNERRTRDTVSTLTQSQDTAQETRFSLVQNLLDSNSPLLSADAVDHLAEEATQAALSHTSETAARLAASCVTSSVISSESLHTVLALTATAIHDAVYHLITSQPNTRIPNTAIEIFASYAKDHLSDVVASDIAVSALVAVHHLVVILPRLHEDGHAVTPLAKQLWEATSSEAVGETAREKILEELAVLIKDVSCRVEPSILVDVALIVKEASSAVIANQLLPETAQIQQMVEEYTSRQPNPTLSIVEPLIAGTLVDDDSPSSTFDAHGRSQAARLSEAALAFIKANRGLATSNPTLLQTVLSARALAQDSLAVPGASRGFLAPNASTESLAAAIREAEGALSFALGSFDEVDIKWHQETVSLLKAVAVGKGDLLQQLLAMLVSGIKGAGDDVAARTLRDVLSRHLRQSGGGEKEAEVWLSYGVSKAETNPILSLAIIFAVKPLLIDSKAFATAQNRLASSLSGVSTRQANDKGIPALRLLTASAPPSDSASMFIPQQRALFVLRHIAGWLTSDDAEDLDEEVETRIAEVYTALAPIVQDVQGGHWDSIFDLIETGLDAGSLDDPTSLPLVYHCLLLLQQVRDLCESNKTLRASWTSKKTHLALVLKLFLQCRDADSTPMQIVQDLLLDLLRDAGEDVVGDGGQEELCTLLGKSTSSTVQTTAYRLLSQVVRRKTLALVLEVETSVSEAPENTRRIEMPAGLIDIVQRGVTVDWHEEPETTMVLGQLLAWMSILDHFDDASRTIRWAYLDQLNTSNLLVDSLLPMLFSIMGVSEVGAWNFPAGQFAVDEFYPDLLQPEELPDLAPLASHVFYRALVTIPSAVRTYYEGLKDRQLSMSMLNFTARHYSPVIIQHEFAALRQPAAMATLTEEGLNVRIAQGGGATVAAGGGSSEAIASYVVDEQPMEIGIRLPAEFPLRGVDVRDLRRVGVPENKWRGWLMSVQQTITSRNGLILEALTVFKKNVSLHFEGVVECAICYSIISLTDRTLPTKPCRTCKNRFHASCLYKWFNSSHSSSCPLCRALF